MRQRAIIGALVLVAVGVVLGATVFRTDIAQATGLAQSVTINNTTANPVPVRAQGTVAVTSTDDPGRNAFAQFKNDSFSATEKTHVVSFTVPAGKRLVIQSISVNAALAGGAKLVLASVQAEVNGQLEDYLMGPTLTGTLEGRDIYVVSQPATIYADGGTDVEVLATRNATDAGLNIMNASVQGYLIDCSAGPCG